MSLRRIAMTMGLIGVLFSMFMVGRQLADNDFNPTTTIRFGEVFTEQNEYAEVLLGDLVLAPQAGHDGKFFFSQAMDPFYLEPDVHAVYLDRPTYRAQRMAYPTLASLGGTLSATAAAWGLIVVNIIAMGVGTAFTSLVAVKMSISRWFGLAFLFNPGMIVAQNIDSGDLVALAALMAGVYYAIRGTLVPAAIALTIACLARETMLIAVAGLGLFLLFRNRRIPWVMVTPVTAVAAWWVYVHWRLEDGLAQDTQALSLPLTGFIEAFRQWLSAPGYTIDLVLGSMLIVLSVMVVVRAFGDPTALAWAVAGFAVLGIVLSEPVWFRYFDSSRALAPLLTAYVLLVPAAASADRHTSDAVDPLRTDRAREGHAGNR